MSQNLGDFTVVDSGSDITVTTSKCDFDTMSRDAVSYVYKDFGADYFPVRFNIYFEVEITAADDVSLATVMGLSNNIGTFQDFGAANDGIVCYMYRADSEVSNGLRAGIIERETDVFAVETVKAAGEGQATGLLYGQFERENSTEISRFKLYSDAERTNILHNIAIAGPGTTYRYLYVLQSRDATGSGTITGYVQNVATLSPAEAGNGSKTKIGPMGLLG